MTDPTLNRRRILAGTAVALSAPVAAVPVLAAAITPDPVHAAIQRHREAYERYNAALAREEELGAAFVARYGPPKVKVGELTDFATGVTTPHYVSTPREIAAMGLSDPMERERLFERLAEAETAQREDKHAFGLTAAEERSGALGDEALDAMAALVTTRPTTVQGAVALAEYVSGWCARDDDDEPARIALATIAAALPALKEGEAVHV